LGQNDFGRAHSQGAMMVYFSESKVFEGKVP